MSVASQRLPALLARLEEHWRLRGASVARLARPGLSDLEIDRLTGALQLRLPTEARVWFRWHDGVDSGQAKAAQIGPRFFLAPLARQVASCAEERSFAQQAVTDGWAEERGDVWDDSWFPILDSPYGRNPLVVRCDIPDGSDSPVGLMDKEGIYWPAGAPSFTDLVEFWVTCHDRGLYRWSPDEGHWGHCTENADILGIPVPLASFF